MLRSPPERFSVQLADTEVEPELSLESTNLAISPLRNEHSNSENQVYINHCSEIEHEVLEFPMVSYWFRSGIHSLGTLCKS